MPGFAAILSFRFRLLKCIVHRHGVGKVLQITYTSEGFSQPFLKELPGSLDIPISPPTQAQPPSVIGLQSIDAYYNAAPAGIIKVKGTLIGPSHADIEGSPTCATVALGRVLGVYGYLGYPTAWMRFQLQNDNYAHGAFVNGTGEIFSETTNWQYVATNVP